jgi:hypothetical protein
MSRGPFSQRVPASLEAGPWARRLAALRAQGRALIDLSDHNPTTAGLGYLADVRLRRALSNPGGRTYLPAAAGLETAREAIATYYTDRGLAVSPAQIVLTSGTSEAYAHAFRLLCDPGDAILVPRPSYPLFDSLAQAEGCRIATYPLVLEDGAWRIDIVALDAVIRATPGLRAIVTVNPNHPTGSFLSKADVAALRAACDAHGLSLICDEVFGDFHGGYGRPQAEIEASLLAPPWSGPAEAPLLLVLSGVSKVCGLPQIKLGWIVVRGKREVVEQAIERLEWLADTFLSVGQPAQYALRHLLGFRGQFQDEVRERVERNRASLARLLRAIPGSALLPADGGWSAVIALPPVRSDEEWALALLEHDVVVHPGYFYNFDEPGRLVLSLLPPPETFDRALKALFEIALG